MSKLNKTISLQEYGSDFHWMELEKCSLKISPWKDTGVFGGSGRDVFRLLLNAGKQLYGWRRLWIPAYFCTDVVESIIETGIKVSVYSYGPTDEALPLDYIDFLPHDVLLVVNYFGVSNRVKYKKHLHAKVTIIEDHTHDPWSEWSYMSDADWCIVSLRKVLPLPDGAALWSPLNHQLPPNVPVTNTRKQASLEKLAGMFLKSLYLNQQGIEKDIFRQLLISGEKDISSGSISDMTDWSKNLLQVFPVDSWRETRRINHRNLSNELDDIPWLSILGNINLHDRCPFSLVMLIDTVERRNFIFAELINSGIYPAILWPLEQSIITDIPGKYIDLSRRILSIHCDMRYDLSDMKYVGKQIRKIGNEFSDGRL